MTNTKIRSTHRRVMSWRCLLGIVLFVLLISASTSRTGAAPTNTNFILQWQADENTDTLSVAWGDVNGDGRADLALGNAPLFDAECGCLVDGHNQLYLSDGALLSSSPIWTSESGERTTGIALEDIDGDGKRDLISANAFAPLKIYRNTGTALPGTPSWTSEAVRIPTPPAVAYGGNENVRGMALADYDNDGDLDIAVASSDAPVRLFRNDSSPGNIVFTLVWSASTSDYSNDVAWGDVNGDGFLDLAVANEGISKLYVNENGALRTAQNINSTSSKGLSVAWGDVNLDGYDDLALGALGQSFIYFGGADGTLSLVDDRLWPALGNEQVRDVAFANANDDAEGRLELFYTNFGRTNSLGVFENSLSEGEISFSTYWLEPEQRTFQALALSDYDNDGDLDMAVGSANNPVRVYRNTLREANANVVVELDGARVAGAFVYRRTSDGTFQPFTDEADGGMVQTDADGVARVGRQLAINDEIAVLLPVFDRASYRSSGPALPISEQGTPTITSSLTVTRSGTVRDLQLVDILGEHGWFGDLVFTLISPQGTALEIFSSTCAPPNASSSFPFRISLSDSATTPASQGQCPPHGSTVLSRPTNPLAAFNGEEAEGLWQLVVQDEYNEEGGVLESWGLTIGTADYPLYYTNARPTPTGISGAIVTNFEQQVFALSSAPDAPNTFPLLLFDLTVSLEWDARNDRGYMAQLKDDLLRSSELLYDFTDGQVALRTISIYQNRERWADADVRVLATNRQRPNADQGGVTTVPYADDEVDDIIYYPGWINMGAVWNRYGNETGTIGEDWPRSLAHELGHFLLYLDDNYIGLIGDASEADLVAIDPPCGGAMYDPYRDEYTEFTPRASWEPTCTHTLSNYYTRRADWETIRLFYPELRAPQTYGANPGPSQQPLAVTTIEEVMPSAPLTTLDNTVFSLVDTSGARIVPGSNTQAYLFPQNGTRLVDVGRPTVDQIDARGVRPGDELCVYELSRTPQPRLGCLNVGDESGTLTLVEKAGWQPDVRVTPLSATTISMTVQARGLGSPTPAALKARFFPVGQNATEVQTFNLSNDVYQTTFAVSTTIETGYIRLWVDETISPRREIIVDYSQLGQPPFGSGSGGPALQEKCEEDNRNCAKKKEKKQAPASADGQALLYFNEQLSPGNYYSLQGTTVLPPPPPWSIVVGRGYRFVTAPGSEGAPRAAINFAYLEREVPAGTEGGLAIYYYDEQTKNWVELRTTRSDPTRNEIAAPLAGDGLYVLITRLPLQNGWNLFAYPWLEAVEVEDGLRAINGQGYTTIYHYNPQGSWLLYDIAVPEYVNTLVRLEYGRGYWVNIEGLATLASEESAKSGSLPLPPATYYGPLSGIPGVQVAAGQTVVARIGEKICGEATTQEYPAGSGKIVFAISVFADDGAQYAGCGVPGRVVSFSVDNTMLPYRAFWNNGRPQQLGLLYLPIVR
jgi:subtilisin-like proprotein convertase family protein